MAIYKLISENLSDTSSATQRVNFIRYFSTTENAKSYAESDYTMKKKIVWRQEPYELVYITSGHLGHVIYTISEIDIDPTY